MLDRRWLQVIPVAFVMYSIAFIGRTNISLALPAVTRDLHITSAEAGSIAGIFFWGYVILQIPGGYIAGRWGTKWFVAASLVAWGTFGVACGLMRTWRELWAMRFLLGLAQGGMYPATLILLSRWFPRRERARANAFFSLAVPMALITSSPLSGWILDRWNWRTMLVIEGALPFLWLLVWIWGILDYPCQARWLSIRDREYLHSAWSQDNAEFESRNPGSYFETLVSRQTAALCCTQFFVLSGQLGYLFWLPSAIGHAGHFSNLSVGLLLTIPYIVGGLAMVVNSWHSDRSCERRRHVTIPLAVGGLLLLAGVLVSKRLPPVAFALITLASIGAFAPLGPFWTLPTELFSKRMAGSVAGMVNSVGQLGGFFGPFLVGYLNRRTGDLFEGFILLAGIMLVASLCPFLLPTGQRPSASEDQRLALLAMSTKKD